MFKSNLNFSRISENSIMKFNQQETLNSFNIALNTKLKEYNGSSETTRANSFNEWLAGLIDAAGCFYISKYNNISCEITLCSKEVKALYKIKEKFHGSVSKSQTSNLFRWRLHKKEHLIFLLKTINGYIYLKIENFKKILDLFNIEFKQYDFSIKNAWFSGFFDGAGHVNLNKNNFQIIISITQKERLVLDLINKTFNGFLVFDKFLKSFIWYVSLEKDLWLLFEYFILNSLKSDKNTDIVSAMRFFRYKLKKYHLNQSKYLKLNHFITLFQKRKKI